VNELLTPTCRFPSSVYTYVHVYQLCWATIITLLGPALPLHPLAPSDPFAHPCSAPRLRLPSTPSYPRSRPSLLPPSEACSRAQQRKNHGAARIPSHAESRIHRMGSVRRARGYPSTPTQLSPTAAPAAAYLRPSGMAARPREIWGRKGTEKTDGDGRRGVENVRTRTRCTCSSLAPCPYTRRLERQRSLCRRVGRSSARLVCP
jgi:hypothetical protein